MYHVRGHRRTAQAFICTHPGESDADGIDVVNVHAPSGKPKLTDAQRMELVRNLLQSPSMTRANCPLAQCKFLIGGDMNTSELRFTQILYQLGQQKNVDIHMPLGGQHGDICLVGNFKTDILRKRATNHDPQHVPYGIAFRSQRQDATEHLTTTPQSQIPTAADTTTESRATGATAAAVPTARTPPPTEHPDESEVPDHTPPTPTCLAQPPDEHEVPELNEPGQYLAYVIVNAFLDDLTLQSTPAEILIKQVILETGEVIHENMLDNVDNVFRPIFFYYPDYPDRTRGRPLDAGSYIMQWRHLAEKRPQHATEQLTKDQVGRIWPQYIEDFTTTRQPTHREMTKELSSRAELKQS